MAQPSAPYTPTAKDVWAAEHYTDSSAAAGRCPIALYIEPQELGFWGAAAGRATAAGYPTADGHTSGGGSGSGGYGPPEPPTALLERIYDTLWPGSPSETKVAGREYDAVCVPLTGDEWKARWDSLCVGGDAADPALAVAAEAWRLAGCFKRSEVNITRQAEALKSICIASQWLELDSSVEGIRLDSELALKQEVQYASYHHVTSLLLPPPRNPVYVADYARAVCSALAASTSVSLSIQIPVSDVGGNVKRPGQAARMATWEDWETIRKLCGYHARLTVTLDLTYFVHSEQLLQRWIPEPVACLFIPAGSFIANAKGYPVLSRLEQAFLKGMLKHGPTMILSQVSKGLHKSGGAAAYVQYLRFIERKVAPPDPIEQYAGSVYLDHLQAPLQPLADHLESQTYTGFEMDPEKYAAYEAAICAALVDRPSTRTHTIFVCGAGRGPLVEASLRAAARASRSVRVKAVEKNPNVWPTLQERQATEWGNLVELVFADCRTFRPDERADILVTELLGSFGDNELSPECIDGAIRWLKDDGISIPRSYCSYIAPLSSSKLHSRVNEAGRAEMPYVVMIHKASIISGEGGARTRPPIAEAWDFVHTSRPEYIRDADGLPITNCHNARSAHLTFHIPLATVCHGFGGYFTAQLYEDISLDIRPDQEMSRKMLSWFPIFFPFKEPLYIPGSSELDIHIWRLTDSGARKVWYEWSADVFLPYSALAASMSAILSPPHATRADLPHHHHHHEQAGRSPTGSGGNAPNTPMLDSVLPGPPTPHFQAYGDPSSARLKIASTSLHNQGGNVSTIGL